MPQSVSSARPVSQKISEEDSLRASLYGLLARFLVRPPDAAGLAAAAALSGDESGLGQAFGALSNIAGATTVDKVAQEYQDLFIGLGRGELLPYGSYYLTGFLNEKPLAKLRNAMATMGIERETGIGEPEDHIGSLMEIMQGLIHGSFGRPCSIAEQKIFFADHVASWAPHFFADLEAAKGSVFYLPIGTLGRIFMEIEETAFAME